MNITSIYRHPEEVDAEITLSRRDIYPETFSLADRTAERMVRARNGLVHVMTELLPDIDDEQSTILYFWLDKILTIVDIARNDAEAN